jgi:hypothetical protein
LGDVGKSATPTGNGHSKHLVLRGTVLGIAVVVGLVAWLSERDGGHSEGDGPEVRIVRPDELDDAAALSGHPVYWAGPVPRTELELTEGADGTVQVRYVEAGAEPGEDRENMLTVGSYPLPDPAGALDAFAARRGSVVRRAENGGEIVTSTESPGSAYFSSPDNGLQVEVYDPVPGRALELVLSGRVRLSG